MNYKSFEAEQSFDLNNSKTLLFFPVRDHYSNSDLNEPPYEDLYNEFKNEYEILLNYKHNIANIPRAISKCKELIFHSQFQLIPIFYSKEFVSTFSNIISEQTSEVKACCLEIIGNLWNCLNDDSTFLTDQEFVANVIRLCDDTHLSDIPPKVYFAMANYCAISKETREYAKSIIRKLNHYMRRETTDGHTKSGLRLSLNLLLHGVDDIWNDIKPLISIFRCHVQSLNIKNRSLAAKCLILILQSKNEKEQEKWPNKKYVDEFRSQDVPKDVYKSIIHLEEYCPRVFDLALLLVQAGLYDDLKMFLSDDFINFCEKILYNFDLNISSFFDLISELMPQINQTLYEKELISRIIDIANDGSFENMKSATFCLIKFMNTVDSQLRIETAANGAFQACCNLIGTSIDSIECIVALLETIYSLLTFDSERFLDLAQSYDLKQSLINSDFEDQTIFEEAQKIINFISENENENDDTLMA